MPINRGAGSSNSIQVFPGEPVPHLLTTAAVNAGLTLTPAAYYSNPERYGFPQQPTPWGFTEERRASLALYDYRRIDDVALTIGD